MPILLKKRSTCLSSSPEAKLKPSCGYMFLLLPSPPSRTPSSPHKLGFYLPIASTSPPHSTDPHPPLDPRNPQIPIEFLWQIRDPLQRRDLSTEHRLWSPGSPHGAVPSGKASIFASKFAPLDMSAPAISFHVCPTRGLCSSAPQHQSCSVPPSSPDCDLFTPRTTSAPSQRPIPGGLSCLFSSPSAVHASTSPSPFAPVVEPDEIGRCCSYPYGSPVRWRDHHHRPSPVSVFQGPASSPSPCGSSCCVGPTPYPVASRDVPEFRWGRDRMFCGFVRNALGSCLDYDTHCVGVAAAAGDEDGTRDPVELNFEMEEEEDREPHATEMLAKLQWRHRIFREESVVRAFHVAKEAHHRRVKASGDLCLQHCVETAALLAEIGADVMVVSAGLLHDTLDNSFLSYDDIFGSLGGGVAKLVEGVAKLSQLSKLARENNTACKSVEADRLHTMFLAMADARAVLIKLADRLHNMMTLDALPPIMQQRFAKETLEIFVPMANRLGVFNWKEQLENLCFKYLYPQQHKELSSELANSFDEAMVAGAKDKLEVVLVAEGISYHVLYGRHKSLYSIFSKMLKKNVNINEIHDISGLRLIVGSEDDCYRALDTVHKLWTHVPGRLKDYIAHPKNNGYQSLHTVVQTEDMRSLEIQIRTKEMHRHAEFGFAAHWRYKEGLCRHSSFVLQVVEWARWVLTWQCETMSKDCDLSFHDRDSIRPSCSFPFHSEDCPYNYRPQDDQDAPIIVILLENELMSVLEFSPSSTLSDLLESVDPGTTQFPLKEDLRPRVNSKPAMDLGLKLKMGDVVELTPAIPDEALTEYREEIQRMFEKGTVDSGADYR